MQMVRKILLLTCLLVIPLNAALSSPIDGFVEQILEPTGGKVQRPVNWFYKEAHSDKKWVWIIAKEDPGVGPYNTGINIQLFREKREVKLPTAEERIANFIEKKKANSVVLSECGVQDAGLFKRRCLETREEGEQAGSPVFRIQYSFFYNNEIDLVAITVAGAPVDEWESAEKIFARMQSIELIDMSRFSGEG